MSICIYKENGRNKSRGVANLWKTKSEFRNQLCFQINNHPSEFLMWKSFKSSLCLAGSNISSALEARAGKPIYTWVILINISCIKGNSVLQPFCGSERTNKIPWGKQRRRNHDFQFPREISASERPAQRREAWSHLPSAPAVPGQLGLRRLAAAVLLLLVYCII